MEPRELYTAMCKLKSAFADAYRAYQKYFKRKIRIILSMMSLWKLQNTSESRQMMLRQTTL